MLLLDHTIWLWICRCELSYYALVHTYTRSGLPAVGLRQLVDWIVSVSDLRRSRWKPGS
jgi:hypothetical protein